MIGKTSWFQRRKYGGWGIAPITWQGWVYTVLAVAPIAIIQTLPFWSAQIRLAITIIWVIVLALDVIHIMTHLKRDEREYKIEAMAERNSAWTMVLMIAVGVAYQSFTSSAAGKSEVDPFLLAALVAGVVAKAISNIYYSRKSL